MYKTLCLVMVKVIVISKQKKVNYNWLLLLVKQI